MQLTDIQNAKFELLVTRVQNKLHGLGSKVKTSIEDMYYSCIYTDSKIINCFYEPCIVIVLQGNKRSIVGNRIFDYGRGNTLSIYVDMPSTYEFYNISKDKPFVSISFNIKSQSLLDVVSKIQNNEKKSLRCIKTNYGVTLDEINDNILNVLLQLTELNEKNIDIDKEILTKPLLTLFYYYIIQLSHGAHILSFYNKLSIQSGISKAINYIKDNYQKDYDIEFLATNIAFMQSSTFFKHFKSVTGLSPLQFKKSMRLVVAKKLIEYQGKSVSESAFTVGYESLSQFSRDFKSYFKYSPSVIK